MSALTPDGSVITKVCILFHSSYINKVHEGWEVRGSNGNNSVMLEVIKARAWM
jgi:hypothetical protein